MNRRAKVVLWKCDKCGQENVLVAYHHKFGWYCEDCLTKIRDNLNHSIDTIQMTRSHVNEVLEQESKARYDETTKEQAQ